VQAVWESGRSEAALAYRRKRGISTPPAVGVVVQRLVEPAAAGVLFTRDPVTGADHIVIEAAWGLGEAVVSGRVTPDSYRIDPGGSILEAVTGVKDVKIWYGDGDGTVEVDVPEPMQTARCLTDGQLQQLYRLVQRCRSVWPGGLDLEWAFDASGALFLLQARPITTAVA
jgi:pyruvate, water dikinase